MRVVFCLGSIIVVLSGLGFVLAALGLFRRDNGLSLGVLFFLIPMFFGGIVCIVGMVGDRQD